MPSRLTTLRKACTNAQFEANPAGCPAASLIGQATVHTPIIPVPLSGPAIFVSHGGEAFPSLTIVLQGDGVTVDLVGTRAQEAVGKGLSPYVGFLVSRWMRSSTRSRVASRTLPSCRARRSREIERTFSGSAKLTAVRPPSGGSTRT